MGVNTDDFFDEIEELDQPRKRRLSVLAAIGVMVLLIAVVVLLFSFVIRPRDTGTPTPTPTSTTVPTSTSTPTSKPPPPTTATTTLVSNDTPTQAPRPTNTSRPTATATPAPAADAVVVADNVSTRPGATTWWLPRRRLPAGTELELIGYDPNFPDWVYVRTTDGAVEGWVQVAGLQINRDLKGLPRITPRPTFVPTPAAPSPTPTLFVICDGGALWLDVWHVSYSCTPPGWTATVFMGGHGGDCIYTYAWDGIVQGGPIRGVLTFEVVSAGRESAIVGTGSVTSAGQTAVKKLYIKPPSCE